MKYRIWDIKENKYLTDEFVVDKNNELLHICLEGTFNFIEFGYSENDYIVQMATGLKDKNGVEIYDGDRVKYSNMVNPIIIYQQGAFGLSESKRMIWKPLFEDYSTIGKFIEVIGNIFENKKEGNNER